MHLFFQARPYLLALLLSLNLSGPAAAISIQTLYSFANGIDGTYPSSRLLLSNEGSLYGAASSGGQFGFGLIFRLDRPASSGQPWSRTILYSFKGGTADGSSPQDIAFGPAGAIYGTASTGGPSGLGGVFRLVPPLQAGGAWTEHILTFFHGADGGFPVSGVTFGNNGALFGTTARGGAFANGIVYKLDPPTSLGGSWKERVLYSFTGGADGSLPSCGLAIGRAGDLYGTASAGGASGNGVVFRLIPPSTVGGAWQNEVLYSFQGGSDGLIPYGGRLVLGRFGSLYGTTLGSSLARSNGGTVFQVKPPSAPGQPWTETPLHQFGLTPDDGFGPESGVIMSATGVLYGTTPLSTSPANNGSVFALIPPAVPGGPWTERVLYSFSAIAPNTGNLPATPLVIGLTGALFGTTSGGGANGFGDVFELH